VFDEANLLSDVQKNNVPIVIVSRDLTGRRVSSVLVDNEAGGALAMQHLLDLGHRKIAVIRGPERCLTVHRAGLNSGRGTGGGNQPG